jgi:hypothetical protein
MGRGPDNRIRNTDRRRGEDMRRAITTLAVMSVILLAAATSATAEQPIRGTMELEWNPCWAETGDVVPDWVGTITFGEDEYGMAFFNIGTGKAFDEVGGRVGFFEEVYRIYDGLVPQVGVPQVGECFVPDPADVLLWGYDRGVFNAVTAKYHMSGSVEFAIGPFAGLAGRRVHMSGLIVDDTAPGVLRIG